MGYSRPQARQAVVPLPAEIDGTNAREAGKDLLAAILPGVTVIVADMTATTFCDTAGINMLALARSQATLQKAKLILVVPSAAILRILAVTGLDLLTPIYPSLDEALSADSLPEAEAAR
jgi:anti-anti-sigma factor